MLALKVLLFSIFAFLGACDMPDYCFLDKADEYNGAWYYQNSDHCKAAGVGDTCCVTIAAGSGTGEPTSPGLNTPETGLAFGDLVVAMSDQTTKDGRFKASQTGHWVCGFAPVTLTTAIGNRGVTKWWVDALQRLIEAHPKENLRAVYFTREADTIACGWSALE